MGGPHNNGREEIFDKLNGALAAFRRERDDLRRKKELATERLRLVTEEREAMEKTILGMQEKLAVLNKSVSDEGKQQLAKLEQEVDRLNKEYQFQHSELVAKKEKITRLEEVMDEETSSRDATVRLARDAVQKRRTKIACQEKPDLCPERQVQAMEKELQEDRIISKMPRLVEQKAAAIAMEAADLYRNNESLVKIVAGYKKQFGNVVIEENPALSMEQ